MVLNRQPSLLCHSCRYDLLALFENGFCRPQLSSFAARRSLLLQPRTSRLQQLQTRRFTSVRPQRRNAGLNEQNVHEGVINGDRALTEAERLQAEFEAIEALEKELGKPLDEAIREDQLASDKERFENGEIWEDADTQVVLEESEDPITLLRRSGASTEEVVRGARTVFGEGLPEELLNQDELKIYVRLYGEPVKEDLDEAVVELMEGVEEDLEEYDETELLLGADGKLLEQTDAGRGDEGIPAQDAEMEDIPTLQEGRLEFSDHNFSPSRSYDDAADRARDIARSLGGEVVEGEEYDRDEDLDEYTGPDERAHPLTKLGKFATSPTTVFLNQETYVRPLTELLGDFSNKQLKEMCERTFGGPGLPDSPLTPRSGKGRKQIAIPLDPSQHIMGEMEANAYVSAVMPPTYAAITSILVETRKRLGSSWLRELLAKPDGPRILDAGAGGAGILAWRDIVDAEWRSLHYPERDVPPTPESKAVVLAGSDALRHRSAALLENTTFVPRLPDYVHSRAGPTLDDSRPLQSRKEFDVIIAPHTLFPVKEEWQRKQQVQNLWSLLSPQGGVLILIEKGVQRGFEAIAGARDLLLTRHISSPGSETYESEMNASLSQEEQITQKDTGMIVAPCTNHLKCPMYTVPGLARGRKDFCSFQQRYIRPGFLQRILGATDRNHDQVDFSYVVVMKGKDIRSHEPATMAEIKDPWNLSSSPTASSSSSSEPPESELTLTTSLPRIIYPSLKRRGHVTMDLCTPAGKIERWTVPKSFDKQAYRDARKSQWGDLWALGAKTKIKRNLQLGSQSAKEQRIKDQMEDEAAEKRELDEEERLNQLQYAKMDDVVPAATVKRETRPPTQKSKAVKEPKPPKQVQAKVNARVSAKAAAKEVELREIEAALEDWEQEFEMDKMDGQKKMRRGRSGGASAGKSGRGRGSSARQTDEERVERFGPAEMIEPWMVGAKEGAGRKRGVKAGR